MTEEIKNRLAVDRLGYIRDQIKALEAEETALRKEVVDGGQLRGDEYVAVIKNFDAQRFDAGGYRAHVGDDALKDFLIRQKRTTVTVKRIS